MPEQQNSLLSGKELERDLILSTFNREQIQNVDSSKNLDVILVKNCGSMNMQQMFVGPPTVLLESCTMQKPFVQSLHQKYTSLRSPSLVLHSKELVLLSRSSIWD